MNQLEPIKKLPEGMETIFCYTDGSAAVAGERAGYGGYGTFFPKLRGEKRAFSAGYFNTKTGRMEVTAVLNAVKNSPDNIHLVVYSDSEYVVKTFSEGRLLKWMNNDWISYGNEVKNVDLWKKILEALRKKPKLRLTLRHIKGHQYDKEKDPEKKKNLLKNKHIFGNTVADRLADYKRHTFYYKDLDNEKK